MAEEQKENQEPKTEALPEEEIEAETLTEEKDTLEKIPEPEEVEYIKPGAEEWKPKTTLGKQVRKGEITEIGTILKAGKVILEEQIVDLLLPNLESELLLIGQSKGKFGGGQRRVFRQTQKKTREGNKPSFATFAVVGNNDGFVGIGYGKSRETVPAREKALRRAKLNVFQVRRGCGSWECNCGEPHSIPFAMSAKIGSIKLTFLPAPKGTGLVCEPELAKILRLAGIKDVWSKMSGQTKVRMNTVQACVLALKHGVQSKIRPKGIESTGMVEGPLPAQKEAETQTEA